jgi:hypothetical protein
MINLNGALVLMKAPSGKWIFRGSVPVNLAYVMKDGSPLTAATKEQLRHASTPAMIARTRVWDSKEEALTSARQEQAVITQICD